MSTKDVGGADDSDKAGGKSDDKSKDTVAYSTYQKTLDEAKELKRKLKEFEDLQKSESEKKLKEQNDWKTLAEQKEAQLSEKSKELDDYKKNLLDSLKISAFNRTLGGKLRRDEYIDFVDLDKIAYNPETKKVDTESVKTVVASFLKEHGHLVEFKKGTLPNESAQGLGKGSVGSSGKPVSQMSAAEYEAEVLRKVQSGEIKF